MRGSTMSYGKFIFSVLIMSVGIGRAIRGDRRLSHSFCTSIMCVCMNGGLNGEGKGIYRGGGLLVKNRGDIT